MSRSARPVLVDGVHHIGVVVDDLDQASRLLEGSFGLEAVGRIDRDDLKAVFYACGGTQIELVELHDEAARATRLGQATARIDHIALAVGDLAAAMAALGALGIEAGTPRESGGMQVAWTVPETSGGVLYQLVEAGDAPTPAAG